MLSSRALRSPVSTGKVFKLLQNSHMYPIHSKSAVAYGSCQVKLFFIRPFRAVIPPLLMNASYAGCLKRRDHCSERINYKLLQNAKSGIKRGIVISLQKRKALQETGPCHTHTASSLPLLPPGPDGVRSAALYETRPPARPFFIWRRERDSNPRYRY